MDTVGASALIAEQPAPKTALVSDYGGAALAELAASRRVLDRLDWWRVDEWAASDGFIAVGQKEELIAAMLAAPVLLDDINRLSSARSDVAWVRWCAVRDGVSATPLVRRMVEACSAALRRAGLRRLMCVAETTHWLTHCLRDAGFQHVDDVVTLALRRSDWRAEPRAPRPASGIHLRSAEPSDMPALLGVDSGAFEMQWRMSAEAFARAWRIAALVDVAESAGQVAGYVLATRFGDEAHIVRLAVSPQQQGQGIGSALLHSALSRLFDADTVHSVTLNTQASNAASLALYRRFGFQPARPRLRVLSLDLERTASRAPGQMSPS